MSRIFSTGIQFMTVNLTEETASPAGGVTTPSSGMQAGALVTTGQAARAECVGRIFFLII